MTTDEMLNRMNGELDIDLYQVIEAKLRAAEKLVDSIKNSEDYVRMATCKEWVLEYEKAGAEP